MSATQRRIVGILLLSWRISLHFRLERKNTPALAFNGGIGFSLLPLRLAYVLSWGIRNLPVCFASVPSARFGFPTGRQEPRTQELTRVRKRGGHVLLGLLWIVRSSESSAKIDAKEVYCNQGTHEDWKRVCPQTTHPWLCQAGTDLTKVN